MINFTDHGLLRSSTNFTDMQNKIFHLRARPLSLREIAAEIQIDLSQHYDNGEYPGTEEPNINANAVITALKWTALGYTWKPNKPGGSRKYLNLDDTFLLLQWADETQPSAEEFRSYAAELRKCRAINASKILNQLKIHGQASRVIDEFYTPSRSWINSFLDKTDFQLKTPEMLEALRYKYVTSASVNAWFGSFMPMLLNLNPYLTFNFDEIMVSIGDCGKVIARRNRGCFSLSLPSTEHATVGITVNAIGKPCPPLLILKNRKKVPKCILSDFASRQIWVGSTEKGWMNKTMFQMWVHLFTDWLQTYRRELPPEFSQGLALVFLDSHPSRASYQALL